MLMVPSRKYGKIKVTVRYAVSARRVRSHEGRLRVCLALRRIRRVLAGEAYEVTEWRVTREISARVARTIRACSATRYESPLRAANKSGECRTRLQKNVDTSRWVARYVDV